MPGIVGRDSPRERPAMPLVVPRRLPEFAASAGLKLRLGGCFAAEERRRRCPAEAEKDDWEASVTWGDDEAARNVGTIGGGVGAWRSTTKSP